MPRLISLRLAIGFLTTLPLPQPSADELTAQPAAWGKSFAWYPLVGALIGGLLLAAHWLLTLTHFSPLVQAGLLLLLWVMLTGALHLDGLLDACDALFAPVSTTHRLEILKDVHTGAFAVLGGMLAVGLKWALLAQLVAQAGASSWLGLVLAPILGRWLMVYVANRYSYARPDVEGRPGSLGSFMRQGLDGAQLVRATLYTTGLLIALWLPLHTDPLLLLRGFSALLLGLLLARWAARRLGGGLTGDLYGALCEVTEIATLLMIAL